MIDAFEVDGSSGFIKHAARALGLGIYFATAIAVVAPRAAQAQAIVNPYVDARYEYDSNVFRAPNSEAIFIANGDPKLSDSDLRYMAGLDAAYLWSDQKFTAKVEGRRFEYDHYGDLDHSEYLADLAMNWKLTSLLDGLLEARQEHAMAPFYLGNSTQLTINTDRNIGGKLNLHFSPDWRLEAGVLSHVLDSPLQNFPDFVERDVTSHLGLVNVGISHLEYGIAFDRIDGRFENAVNVGPYTQNNTSLTVKYTLSALTTFNAAAGYTKRDQTSNGGNVSGFTGDLRYTRQLTAKTSLSLDVSRVVNSYAAAAASEVDTTATAIVNWQATYRIGVALNLGYIHSDFVGQAIPGSNDNGRIDHSPTESLNVTYQVLRRLLLRGYLTKQSRSSNIEEFNFSDTLIGLEAKYTFGRPPTTP
jgi:Putative beta-barrel porin 2